MKFLITGGAGFIGSHLADELLSHGHTVTVLDNLSTGSLENLAALADRPVRFVAGSVLDELLVDELVMEADTVVHLAAAVGVKKIVDEPLKSFITNVRGGETVLAAAHRYRKRILLASTSEIYGKNGGGPLRETDDRILGVPTISRWSYSTAKAVDEILAFAYHREKGLESTVVRFFNTVGPRQSPAYGMVIPTFVKQALAGEDITVYGDGMQSRCFCHVSDVVGAVVGLLGTDRSIGEAYNIGSTDEITMMALAERVIALTGARSQVKLIPYEEAYSAGFEDMRRRVPDTSKIRSLTGWQPTYALDDILRHVISQTAEPLETCPPETSIVTRRVLGTSTVPADARSRRPNVQATTPTAP